MKFYTKVMTIINKYNMFRLLKLDFNRYKKENGFYDLVEPSLYLIILYRFGSAIRGIRFSPLRIILSLLHLPFYILLSMFLGIQIPRGAKIGGGLKIYHFGCIVLNPETIIGNNCTLRQGVTIGNKNDIYDVPVIGDNVDIGAGAKVLGKIKIGNNVSIGANAVVLVDVPDNSIAVGVPARVLKKRNIL